jgi:hypothetical protein
LPKTAGISIVKSVIPVIEIGQSFESHEPHIATSPFCYDPTLVRGTS